MKKPLWFMPFLLGISLTTLAQTHVTPFTDNLAITLNGFPPNTQVIATYMSDNGVNIIGPAFTSVSGSAQLPVQISSHNLIENGYPAMNLSFAASSSTCRLQFVDGPYSYLNFANGTPPNCTHLTISNITPAGQYNYYLNLTYKK